MQIKLIKLKSINGKSGITLPLTNSFFFFEFRSDVNLAYFKIQSDYRLREKCVE